MKTDDLIDILVADRAVLPVRPRPAMVYAILCGAVIGSTIFMMTLGFRPDIVEAAGTYRFLFKFIFTATLTASAIALMFRIRRPEAAVGRWLCLLAIAPVMLMAAATAELLVMPSSTWMPRMIGTNARFCLTVIPLLSIVPLCAFLTALRQTAPANPGLAGSLAGLGAGGIGATLYASHCFDDSPLFVLVWYSLAIALVTAVGFFAGRHLLRW